jgi:hypothetical protein
MGGEPVPGLAPLSETSSKTLSRQRNQISGLSSEESVELVMRQHSVAALTKKLDKGSDKGSDKGRPKGPQNVENSKPGMLSPAYIQQSSGLKLPRSDIWATLMPAPTGSQSPLAKRDRCLPNLAKRVGQVRAKWDDKNWARCRFRRWRE